MRKDRIALLLGTLLVFFSGITAPAQHARAATGTVPYVGFRKQTTAAEFAGSTLTGVIVESRGGGAAISLVPTGLATGTNLKRYGVKSYSYGTLVSPIFDAASPFDTAIASWNALTPSGTWMQIELRAYRPGDRQWTKYYTMGIWASGTTTIKRQSVAGQGDADGSVATDTLRLRGDQLATRYQYRLTLFTTGRRLSPTVRLVSVMTSASSEEARGLDLESDRQVWETELNVPQRSQMIYKGGGEVWCSPTSTSMVLAYWGFPVAVPTAAAATYDYVYRGNGTWPFNTAWAGTFGLEAYVTRLSSMAQVEEWISAGVPVIMSYAAGPGELPGTPYTSTRGHIMVIRGFDTQGNVIVNDPAGTLDARVRFVYDRSILERLWLTHSGGTVYIIHPRSLAVPTTHRNGNW